MSEQLERRKRANSKPRATHNLSVYDHSSLNRQTESEREKQTVTDRVRERERQRDTHTERERLVHMLIVCRSGY